MARLRVQVNSTKPGNTTEGGFTPRVRFLGQKNCAPRKHSTAALTLACLLSVEIPFPYFILSALPGHLPERPAIRGRCLDRPREHGERNTRAPSLPARSVRSRLPARLGPVTRGFTRLGETAGRVGGAATVTPAAHRRRRVPVACPTDAAYPGQQRPRGDRV